MLQKHPVFSKGAHRMLEWSLIVCGFALAMIVIVYGMKQTGTASRSLSYESHLRYLVSASKADTAASAFT
jgi:hypothetical protein